MSKKQPLESPTAQDASHYNMDHPKRGMALIFSHDTYKGDYAHKRKGTIIDCERLRKSLEMLEFEVLEYHNLNFEDIKSRLQKVSEMDHTDHDCLAVVVLTHGELGKLFAHDHIYDINVIFSYFTAGNCESLVGKPKMFFIQACQGTGLNPPVTLRERTVTDGCTTFTIPTYADVLIAQSTIPGYYSWRNLETGSWFIKALCSELDENGTQVDLLTLLTFVARRVAIDYESHVPESPSMHQQKQIPCITSMLMRVVKFRPKNGDAIDRAT